MARGETRICRPGKSADASDGPLESADMVIGLPCRPSQAPDVGGEEPEARFTWDELRPFLRAGAPLPPR